MWRRALAGLLRGRIWDGPEIEAFEKAFAEFVGVPHAITVPSGRAGLKFIIEGLELPSGGEVIVPAFTYPIVPAVVKAAGCTLRFADCEMTALGIDPEALATRVSPATKVILATHLYGVPCRIGEIQEIARGCGAIVIEDCAHACGARVGQQRTGAIGRAAYFSFETSKCINTLGGGMITTTDVALAERIRAIRAREQRQGAAWLLKRLMTTSFEALATSPLLFNLAVYPALRLVALKGGADDAVATAYVGDEDTVVAPRMGCYTNYQAALGLEQLGALGARNERRKANATRLMDALHELVAFQRAAGPDDESNYMLVTALFPDMEAMALQLLKLGVDTKRRYIRDCSRLFDTGEHFPNAARAEREALHLPAYPELSLAAIDHVAAKVRQATR